MGTSQIVQVGNRKLLPVKEVVSSVPYSRDYITRLARESKIVAVQIDRQWLVDPESVQSFYEQSKIEDQVRSVQLRNERKRERKVKEFLSQHQTKLVKRNSRLHTQTLSLTTMVVGIGMVTGLGLYTALTNLNSNWAIQMAQLPLKSVIDLVTPLPEQSENAAQVPVVVYDYSVIEQTESFDVSRGILLLPATSTDEIALLDMLSDPVEVVSVGTSSGLVRMSNGTEVYMPFVEIPVMIPTDSETVHSTL